MKQFQRKTTQLFGQSFVNGPLMRPQYVRCFTFPSWIWPRSPLPSPAHSAGPLSSHPVSTPSAFSKTETEGAPGERPLPTKPLCSITLISSPPPSGCLLKALYAPSSLSCPPLDLAGGPQVKASHLFSSHCAHSPRQCEAIGRCFTSLRGCWRVTPLALACRAISSLSEVTLPFPLSLLVCHRAHPCLPA